MAHLPDAIKEYSGFTERGQNINIKRSLDDFEEFKNSKEEVTADGSGESQRTRFRSEPGDGTKLLQSYDETLMLLLTDEQRRWLLEMGSPPSEDAV